MISNLNRFVYSSGEEDNGIFFDENDETFDEEEPSYIPSKAMSKYASNPNPVQEGKRLTKKLDRSDLQKLTKASSLKDQPDKLYKDDGQPYNSIFSEAVYASNETDKVGQQTSEPEKVTDLKDLNKLYAQQA